MRGRIGVHCFGMRSFADSVKPVGLLTMVAVTWSAAEPTVHARTGMSRVAATQPQRVTNFRAHRGHRVSRWAYRRYAAHQPRERPCVPLRSTHGYCCVTATRTRASFYNLCKNRWALQFGSAYLFVHLAIRGYHTRGQIQTAQF